jgi:hypothetical protein
VLISYSIANIPFCKRNILSIMHRTAAAVTILIS